MNRQADTTAAFGGIQNGIKDFRRAPALSLLYGFLFAGLCAGIYLLIRNIYWYVTGYLTGLVVLGPFLAGGLYAASRDMEKGSAPSISASLHLMLRGVTLAAMTVWAATILALTTVGIATAFVGFAVIFPVLGYATWHSYRALVR